MEISFAVPPKVCVRVTPGIFPKGPSKIAAVNPSETLSGVIPGFDQKI